MWNSRGLRVCLLKRGQQVQWHSIEPIHLAWGRSRGRRYVHDSIATGVISVGAVSTAGSGTFREPPEPSDTAESAPGTAVGAGSSVHDGPKETDDLAERQTQRSHLRAWNSRGNPTGSDRI